MQSNKSTVRLLLCIAIIIMVIAQWFMHLGFTSFLGLSACVLFILSSLTLFRHKRKTWFLSGLLILTLLGTVILDNYAFSLAGDMQTAMLSMKMMALVRVVQNLVISIYLLICIKLLWQDLWRETHWLTQFLSWAIALYFALQWLPATWFTLQFIFASLVG